MITNVLNNTINEWGNTKTIQVILTVICGGTLFGLAAVSFIPNNPRYLEKGV